MEATDARNYQIQNYCYNIKAYHEKQGEEQFYDFTIKDKDGAKIQSHKFILASQSEFFAGHFRMNPTASEVTFKNFSVDVIKTCIDYLYIHRVNLTASNVQNVLVFADYISLADVVDICTNHIIKNIDECNYMMVMSLGNTQGMDQLVEAGVLFVVRNPKIIFNDFTKNMILKVARWQQKRPTIMTREQWIISQLQSKFMSELEEDTVFHTRCSSVYSDSPHNWGPHLAVNGKISNSDIHYFHSQEEMHPWLEVKLPFPILMSSVTIINRQNGYWDRLRNLEIRAGMKPVPDDFTTHARGCHGNKQLDVNSPCGYFEGPAEDSVEGPVIMFFKPTLAQYLTLQIMQHGILQINGLKINGGTLLNSEDVFHPTKEGLK